MPELRAFRALRFDQDTVGDVGKVVAPPYDVIGDDLHRALLERHPRNAVRLDLPEALPREDPDERYRRAARTLSAWRSDGTLHKDSRPSVYVYEQVYRVPGTDHERTQRGFFARLRIEPFGPDSRVLPHERTLSGPKEDRYRLLRATCSTCSPVVGLFRDADGEADAAWPDVVAGTPTVDVTDDDGVRHRLWVVPDEGEASDAGALLRVAGDGPVWIADGHHRYETALRYRDERRDGAGETDPALDFVLMLFLPRRAAHGPADPPGARGLGRRRRDAPGRPRSADLFYVSEATPDDPRRLVRGGRRAPRRRRARFGLVTRAGAWLLACDARCVRRHCRRPGRVRRCACSDVTRLGTVLERLAGIDAAAVAAGDRIRYTKSAAEAVASWSRAARRRCHVPARGHAGRPRSRVAAAGEVMPQKSTFFDPKAPTGLVFGPLEW